jgi:hypothetical protein
MQFSSELGIDFEFLCLSLSTDFSGYDSISSEVMCLE